MAHYSVQLVGGAFDDRGPPGMGTELALAGVVGVLAYALGASALWAVAAGVSAPLLMWLVLTW